MICPNCKIELPLNIAASAMGKCTSHKKAKAARENGKKNKGKKK